MAKPLYGLPEPTVQQYNTCICIFMYCIEIQVFLMYLLSDTITGILKPCILLLNTMKYMMYQREYTLYCIEIHVFLMYLLTDTIHIILKLYIGNTDKIHVLYRCTVDHSM